jgi:hypothetical protein
MDKSSDPTTYILVDGNSSELPRYWDRFQYSPAQNAIEMWDVKCTFQALVARSIH